MILRHRSAFRICIGAVQNAHHTTHREMYRSAPLLFNQLELAIADTLEIPDPSLNVIMQTNYVNSQDSEYVLL